MTKHDFLARTKKFAIEVAKLIQQLPYNLINKNYSNQLIRCSGSVAANHRAACRGKSTADFLNKLKIVEEELDESIFFLELLETFNPDFAAQIEILRKEGNELLAIFVQSINTTRKRMNT